MMARLAGKDERNATVGKTLTHKLIESHLAAGRIEPGSEIGIRIDQTLTQDATGTMAYLQFEAMGIGRVRTELSMSYIDHNTIQIGFENADDHRYLHSVARRYGIRLSRAGNGICHQVHLERFGRPGKTLLGSDSHTSTCGALGMLAIGAGGLDVALAMAGEPFFLTCPRVIRVNLTGKLPPWVSAKDVILKLLEIFTTRGNVGHVFEYGGEGLESLTVPERATIANMGAELGLTTSVFPSDAVTRRFLAAEQREADWAELAALVQTSAQPGDGIIFDESGEPWFRPRLAMRGYPAGFDQVDDVLGTGLVAEDVWDTQVLSIDQADWLGKLGMYDRIWLVEHVGQPSEHERATLEAAGFRAGETQLIHSTQLTLFSR